MTRLLSPVYFDPLDQWAALLPLTVFRLAPRVSDAVMIIPHSGLRPSLREVIDDGLIGLAGLPSDPILPMTRVMDAPTLSRRPGRVLTFSIGAFSGGRFSRLAMSPIGSHLVSPRMIGVATFSVRAEAGPLRPGAAPTMLMRLETVFVDSRMRGRGYGRALGAAGAQAMAPIAIRACAVLGRVLFEAEAMSPGGLAAAIACRDALAGALTLPVDADIETRFQMNPSAAAIARSGPPAPPMAAMTG